MTYNGAVTDLQEADLIGQVLQDTYLITRPIAEGGMGVVYEAAHVRLSKKRYAVKVLMSSIMHMPNVYARFQREAEIASELGHPNIVDVQDSNTTSDGRAYIVMEYLEGQDMGARLEEGPMSPREVVDLVRQVASALQMAHDNGVVHRDMKPANIFLVDSPDGESRVKVLDFGISKITHSQSIVTAEQSLLGTVYYMSPEQAEGCIPDIDHLTDIFALGTICYQALSGLLPFIAPTMPGVIYQICHKQQTPITELMPELPPAVNRVLDRAMAKQKEDRYQRVEEFAEDLDRALEGMTGVKPSPPPPDADDLRITAKKPVVSGQLPKLSSSKRAVSDQDETRVKPLSELGMQPVAPGTDIIPLDELRGEEEATTGKVPPAEMGDTSLVPMDEILAGALPTGPDQPATPPPGALPTGPEQPGAQPVVATAPGMPSRPPLTTISGSAGQSGVELIGKPKSRLSRRLALPLLILFWVGLAVGIFMLASGPPESAPKTTSAGGGEDVVEARQPDEETANDEGTEEPVTRPPLPRGIREVRASAEPDAGQPDAGPAAPAAASPDAGGAVQPASMASVKHRKAGPRRKKPRRPRKRRRPAKKKKQPIVGFDKL